MSALHAVFNLSIAPVSVELPRALAPAEGAPLVDTGIEGGMLALPPYDVFFGVLLDAA